MPITTLSLAVVGADFPNRRGPGRRFEIELCAPGEPIILTPEPKNPADPRAVAAFSVRGVQLGYLTAERCGLIGGMIARGREMHCAFQEKAPFGALVRLAFDGAEPILPPSKPRLPAPDDSGFWPDDEYLDD